MYIQSTYNNNIASKWHNNGAYYGNQIDTFLLYVE